jgi:arylsulfatase A-like enzyme
MNMPLCFPLLISMFLIVSGATAMPSSKSASRPNILIILADDLGYADLNINNPAANSPTPYLNELAESGVRFTRHYTESTCSPSRAALITGSYPARINFKPNGLGIPTELDTLPKTFKAAGYRTHQIGKWHLGHLIPEAWPNAQGFDTWLGFLNQWLMTNSERDNGFNYGKATYLNAFLQNEQGELKKFYGHLTDVTSDETIRLIRTEKRNSPWLIYLAAYAPHEPIQPRTDYAARYPNTQAGRYAALVAHLDDRISDIIKTLEDTGQRKNTIVVFASDNGGTNKYLDNNAPFVGKKTEYLEGGVRTPLLISWPGKIPARLTDNRVVSIMDIYPTLATLANVKIQNKIDGVSLFTRNGKLVKLKDRALYWEMNADLERRYSTLSPDGRWRLYQDWRGDPSLFDLKQDPTSSTNVAANHPDIVEQLHAAYEQWATSVARIHLRMTSLDQDGHAILNGDQIQRAVTLSDFTVAIGVTPKHTAINERVILEQKSMLRISENGSGLHIRFHGLNTDLPSLPIMQCSSLIMTGTLNRKIESIDFGSSTLNIYLDGKQIKSIKQALPLLDSTNVRNATYVGISDDSSQRFDGTLSEPIYLNRRIDLYAPVALSVNSLSNQVCTSSIKGRVIK